MNFPDISIQCNFFHYGNRAKNKIAITFDDGPSEQTDKILAILEKYSVKATFFIIGKRVNSREELIQKIKEGGHEFGNHTFSHEKLWFKSKKLIQEEIARCDTELGRLGITTDLFRFPALRFGWNALAICEKLGKRIISADVLAYDWVSYDWLNPWFKKRKDIVGELKIKKVVKKVLNGVQNGSIIIFHDYLEGVGEHAEIGEILESILPELKKRGFQFVTISCLMVQQ